MRSNLPLPYGTGVSRTGHRLVDHGHGGEVASGRPIFVLACRELKQYTRAMLLFSKVIAARIKSQGISVSEVARRAGISRPYLHRLLAAQHDPTLDVAERIAKVLGMSLKLTKSRLDT